jgi:hypothetical protein
MRLYRIMNHALFRVTNDDFDRPRCKQGRYRRLVYGEGFLICENLFKRVLKQFIFV